MWGRGPPCTNKIILIHVNSVQGGRGSIGSLDGEGPQTDKTPAAKSLYRSIFLDYYVWHCFLSFYVVSLSLNNPK